MNPLANCTGSARRRALATLATLPWWTPALGAFAQTALPALPPLDERTRGIKLERGGLSLDIPTIAETGASVPIVLFVNPASLGTRRVARLGIWPHSIRGQWCLKSSWARR